MLAEGLPAETWLDTGNRGLFQNGGVPLVLHPDPEAQPRREDLSCLPFRLDPDGVLPVWRALAETAEQLGLPVPVLAETQDPAPFLTLDGRRIAPISGKPISGEAVLGEAGSGEAVLGEPISGKQVSGKPISGETISDEPTSGEAGVYVFVIPADTGVVHLCSRHAIPAESRPWLEDRRRLGLRVAALTLRHGAAVTRIALDDPALNSGWWAVESDQGATRRWTNGKATLPPLPGPSVLEVRVAETLAYPLRRPEAPKTAARVA